MESPPEYFFFFFAVVPSFNSQNGAKRMSTTSPRRIGGPSIEALREELSSARLKRESENRKKKRVSNTSGGWFWRCHIKPAVKEAKTGQKMKSRSHNPTSERVWPVLFFPPSSLLFEGSQSAVPFSEATSVKKRSANNKEIPTRQKGGSQPFKKIWLYRSLFRVVYLAASGLTGPCVLFSSSKTLVYSIHSLSNRPRW